MAQAYAAEWFAEEMPEEETRYLIPPDRIVKPFKENYGKKFRVIPVEKKLVSRHLGELLYSS